MKLHVFSAEGVTAKILLSLNSAMTHLFSDVQHQPQTNSAATAYFADVIKCGYSCTQTCGNRLLPLDQNLGRMSSNRFQTFHNDLGFC